MNGFMHLIYNFSSWKFQLLMNIRIFSIMILFGLSGALYANEAPQKPMSTMSDDELGAVSDHDDSKENAEEHSAHEHEDQNSLIKSMLLKTESNIQTQVQPIIPQNISNRP